MIKPPTGTKIDRRPRPFLGKSKKGVYCALVFSNYYREHTLEVWLLTESCGKMEWTFNAAVDLLPVVEKFSNFDDDIMGPWILHKGWSDEGVEEATVEDNSEWDFDNGVILETREKDEYLQGTIQFLGFHPYKEIAFFWVSGVRVVAYDFSTSKVQDLGLLLVQSIGDCFPYTPCWIGELLKKN
jgi:hypothetical protein